MNPVYTCIYIERRVILEPTKLDLFFILIIMSDTGIITSYTCMSLISSAVSELENVYYRD